MKATHLGAVCAALILALFAARAASAQLMGGYRADRAAEPQGRFLSSKDQARATLDAYARCLVDARRLDVERATVLPPGVVSEKALHRVAINECLSFGQLRFSPEMLRGALFIELYRRKFGAHVPAIANQPVDFEVDLPADDERHEALMILRQFADCAVRADPADAHKAVVSAVGSKDESTAYTGLAPHLNACLRDGQKITFTKSVLSGLIAEVLYRDAVATKPAETH